MAIETIDIPDTGVDFEQEAEKLAGTPKQGYIEDVDFEETQDNGAQSADQAQKEHEQKEQSEQGDGTAMRSAKLAFTLTDFLIPKVAAARMDTDAAKFKAKATDKDDIIELYRAFFEYHNYNFDDPTVALVFGLAMVYGLPIWEYNQEQKKQVPKPDFTAKADKTNPKTETVEAEEVSDEEIEREKPEIITAVNKKGARVCAWKDCNNELKSTQKKYCSHSCRAHGSNENRA